MPGRWCGRGGGFNAGQVARPGGFYARQARQECGALGIEATLGKPSRRASTQSRLASPYLESLGEPVLRVVGRASTHWANPYSESLGEPVLIGQARAQSCWARCACFRHVKSGLARTQRTPLVQWPATFTVACTPLAQRPATCTAASMPLVQRPPLSQWPPPPPLSQRPPHPPTHDATVPARPGCLLGAVVPTSARSALQVPARHCARSARLVPARHVYLLVPARHSPASQQSSPG